jgi:NADPH:quinone reductase-like Zn-dependent oxidoreductase
MKQIRINEQGDTDVMKLEDVPIPQPQAGLGQESRDRRKLY